MVKGAHHQIVEIRQADHPFFERALLFVRTDCSEPTHALEQAGEQYLRATQPYSWLRRCRRRRLLRATGMIFGGGLGGVLLGILCEKWL